MRKITFVLIGIALLASVPASAQDAARPSVRQAPALNFGLACPAGQVVTLNPATGGMQCTDTVAKSTTSGVAEALDAAAKVNGNQVNGAVAEAKTVSGGGTGAGASCWSQHNQREIANGGSFRLPWGSSSGFGMCICNSGSWTMLNTEGGGC